MCLAIPARIVAIAEGSGLARQGRIVVEGTERDVNLALVPEVAVGDYVITHAGFALRRTEPFETTPNERGGSDGDFFPHDRSIDGFLHTSGRTGTPVGPPHGTRGQHRDDAGEQQGEDDG